MESETIQYIPKELQDRLIALGFTELSERTVSHEGKAFTEYGITIEQAERWIWKEHRELFPISYTMMVKAELVFGIVKMVDLSNVPIYFPDPFSARLAGVERVIEELEKRQSIAQMEKGTR